MEVHCGDNTSPRSVFIEWIVDGGPSVMPLPASSHMLPATTL